MTAKTANISLEVDSGIKRRAMAVREAKGMTLSGAIRRMVTLGMLEHRIPFEVTRDPVFAGTGMADCVAERYGIEKSSSPRTGMPEGDAKLLQGDVHHPERAGAPVSRAGCLRAACPLRRLNGGSI